MQRPRKNESVQSVFKMAVAEKLRMQSYERKYTVFVFLTYWVEEEFEKVLRVN